MIADILLVIAAFVIGSVPMGPIVAKLIYRTDIREVGSGNIGAANMLRSLGREAGVSVLLLDALKGFVPTICAHYLGGVGVAFVAGFAAVAGHCYSPWMGFKGGKGVATELGVLFALSWQAGLIFMAIWALAVWATGFASVGSLIASFSAILTLWLFLGAGAAIYGLCVTALITWRHRENIRRLREGRENRLIGASGSASNPGGLP